MKLQWKIKCFVANWRVGSKLVSNQQAANREGNERQLANILMISQF